MNAQPGMSALAVQGRLQFGALKALALQLVKGCAINVLQDGAQIMPELTALIARRATNVLTRCLGRHRVKPAPLPLEFL